jgi:hypothetical protein
MSLEHSPARQRGATQAPRPQDLAADPILSFHQCAEELGMNVRTFWRSVVPYVDTVRLSPQRRGVRRSVLEAFKRARTIPAKRPLETVP